MICGLQFGFLMEHKLRATNRKPLRGGAFCVFACLFEQRHSHPFSATKEEKEEVTVSDSTVTHVPILLRLFSPVKYKKEKRRQRSCRRILSEIRSPVVVIPLIIDLPGVVILISVLDPEETGDSFRITLRSFLCSRTLTPPDQRDSYSSFKHDMLSSEYRNKWHSVGELLVQSWFEVCKRQDMSKACALQ